MSFTCLLCESNDSPSTVRETVKGDANAALTVVRCARCAHVQLNPPTYSLEYYSQDRQVNVVVHDYGTPIEKIVEHSWIDARRRLDRFSTTGIDLAAMAKARPLRVLDIGGGYGFFGSELKRAYPTFEVSVMEPSSKRASIGRDYLTSGAEHAIPEFVTELLDDAFVTRHRGTWDLVTMWHVLEHVPNPVEFLSLACQLAVPGTGVVCVEVPNLCDELMTMSPAFRDRNYMVEHISYFSPISLDTIARMAAPKARHEVRGYQRYGIFNYFHWIHFNKPQGANPDLFDGRDRWWLESTWRTAREQAMTSDALFLSIRMGDG